MPDDITELILADHHIFRRGFITLDDLSVRNDPDELSSAWRPLADLLEVHAAAEEEIFYPRLLRQEGTAAEEDTVDAIGDHNEIRDAVRDAARFPVGSDQWWDAVRQARLANDEHLAEEERDPIANFRKHASLELREALGKRFREFKAAHPDQRGLDTGDKDPERYVEQVERRVGVGGPPDDGSLGIGGLRGR